MNPEDTLYIAQLLFSAKLKKFDSSLCFPPVKKIGVCTEPVEKMEHSLADPENPMQLRILKAWRNVDTKSVHTLLHTILGSFHIDGEYFWDSEDSLVEAVTDLITQFQIGAIEIPFGDSAAPKKTKSDIDAKSRSIRLYSQVIPFLEELDIMYRVTKDGSGVRLSLGAYRLHLASKSNGRYTLTIWSKASSTEQALKDFPGAIPVASTRSDNSDRKARIPMSNMVIIIRAIKAYTEKVHKQNLKGRKTRSQTGI